MDDTCFDPPRYRVCGDTGLLMEYGNQISPKIHERVMSMAHALERNPIQGITAVIPTYAALLVVYDPFQTDPAHLVQSFSHIVPEERQDLPERVEIPVCYEGEFALDMETLAAARGLDPHEVIQIHTQPEYRVYMVGFTPGFAFLGGLDSRLYTPRLETPRIRVPKGSVGIANNQTGIYSIDSPGGWQIIGRTPLTLFAPHRPTPFLYKPGDWIKFVTITASEFKDLAAHEARR